MLNNNLDLHACALYLLREERRRSVCLLLFSHSVISDSLWPGGLWHARLPFPSLSLRVCLYSCPLSQWCHPTISSCCPLLLPSVFLSIRVFSNESALQSGGQSTGASASASVLPMNVQDWSPLGLTGFISMQSKGLSRVFSRTTVCLYLSCIIP